MYKQILNHNFTDSSFGLALHCNLSMYYVFVEKEYAALARGFTEREVMLQFAGRSAVYQEPI